MVDAMMASLLATLFLLFCIVALVQRRLRRLIEERSDTEGGPRPRRIWGSSPRESWTFLGQLLRRDYAKLGDPSVRRWGDLLLFAYAVYAVVLATVAGVLLFRQ